MFDSKLATKLSLAVALSVFLEPLGFCTEVILTPASVLAGKQLQTLFPHSKPVFNASEMKALSQMGEPELAVSRKMEASEKALPSIRDRLRRRQVKANVQINAPVHTLSGTAAWDLNWGLNNTGTSQKVALDDLSTLEINGKKNEDVGLTRLSSEVWNRLSHPKKNITVAILDTGIDWTHPSLSHSIALHTDECKVLSDFSECVKNAKIDSEKKQCSQKYVTQDLDKNGYPLDCHGWSFVVPGAVELEGLGSPEFTDDVGHGTHVAGMVKALAPFAKILPVKVIRSQPNAPIRPQSSENEESQSPPLPSPLDREIRSATGFTDTVARGMLYAIRSGVDIINLSLAWPEAAESELFEKMLKLAKKHSIIIVAAAGNDSTESRVYPCQHSSVVCVAAHGPDGALSHFSNFGSFVDIAAPGLNIISSWPIAKRPIALTGVPGFELKNGTSMASPQVAGALASLVSLGISPEEAKARIMVSASRFRPVSQATYPNPAHIFKWVRSGNLDLARAIEQTPEPLITPAEKLILEIPFMVSKNSDTLVGTEFPVSFELINHWTPSATTEIRASLHGTDLNAPISSQEASLNRESWFESHWASQEKKKFSTSLKIGSDSISGRLNLKLLITTQANLASAKHTDFYTIPIELTHVIGPSETRSLRQLRIVNASGTPMSFDETWDIRSVRHTNQDYLAIRSKPTGETQIAFLTQDSVKNQMNVTGPVDIKLAAGAELLMVDALPEETALIFKVPPTDPTARNPSFQFHFFDARLNSNRMLEHDNDVTVVDERFQWFKTDEGFVPAWIGFGKFPKNEKPKITPWEPKPKDSMTSRLYYLSKSGLRSATADSKLKPAQMWIQLLNKESISNFLEVFVGTGRDYTLTYERIIIEYDQETKTPAIKDRIALIQPEYRNLLGLTYRDENQRDASAPATTVVSGSSSRGKLRLTVIPSSKDDGVLLEDKILSAPSVLDTVVDSIGTFYSKNSSGKDKLSGVFSQTHYELVYTDLIENKNTSVSLERFSFLPSFIAARSFFPITASIEKHSSLPAVLIPESLGSTHATEVIVADPKLGLNRPAWLRVRPNADCEIMGNPVFTKLAYPLGTKLAGSRDTEEATELSLYCHDSFYRFPIDVGTH